MRVRTLLAITFTMFALPAAAAELPGPLPLRRMPPPVAPDVAETSVCYEVRVIKARAGFLERVGVKLNGEVVLTAAELRQILEAVQGDRDASITQLPRITVADGETARVSICENRSFVTGLDAMKVKGATVLVPKNTPIELGDRVTLTGSIAAGGKSVRVHSHYTRTRVEGVVELLPVTTQITPVFEGGSQGKPIPFTQFLQSPDVRTEKAEKTMTVTSDGTYVLGGWKETAEAPAVKGKPVPRREKAEYEVLALATVRVLRTELAPMPHEIRPITYKLRNVSAADAAHAIGAFLKEQKLDAAVVAEPVSNSLLVSGEVVVCERVAEILAKLDKQPQQVVVQAMLIEVPRGFGEQCGLTDGKAPYLLSQREQQMLNTILRAAKEKCTLDVLARPQVCVNDGQTGCVQVGQQQHPIVTHPAIEQAGVVTEAKVQYVTTGLTFRVTPTVAPDGKAVRLSTEAQHTTRAPRDVQLGDGPKAVLVPAFNEQSMRMTAEVKSGEMLVIPMHASQAGGSFLRVLRQHAKADAIETYLFVTPVVVSAP